MSLYQFQAMDNLKKLRKHQISLSKCEICEKEFKNNNGLKCHFNFVHSLEKEYQCNICQNAYKLQSQLTFHVTSVHENKKYHKCDSCEKFLAYLEHISTSCILLAYDLLEGPVAPLSGASRPARGLG